MLLKYASLIAGLIVTTSAFAQLANADILNVQGEKIGTVQIQPSRDGVRITLQVSQLPAGTHGIHIHNVGKSQGPAFAKGRILCFTTRAERHS